MPRMGGVLLLEVPSTSATSLSKGQWRFGLGSCYATAKASWPEPGRTARRLRVCADVALSLAVSQARG